MKSKYTKEILLPIIQESYSFKQVIAKLGLSYNGGNHRHIKNVIEYYQIDTSHFKGQAINKGITYKKLQPEDYLIYDETNYRHSYKVKNLILRDNIKPHQCEKCLFTEWNGLPIPLELHHKDGNKLNNLLDNLELLCPNCHAQTKNYRGKAKKSNTPIINIKEYKEEKIKQKTYCKDCGIELTGKQKTFCSVNCSNRYRAKQKDQCPEKEILLKDIVEYKNNLTAIARKYNVSHTTIKRWKKKHKIA